MRHSRAGHGDTDYITVAELIRNQPIPAERAADEMEAALGISQNVVEERAQSQASEPDAPQRKSRPIAVIAATVGALLLIIATTAIATLSSGTNTDSAKPIPAAIEGSRALNLEAVHRELGIGASEVPAPGGSSELLTSPTEPKDTGQTNPAVGTARSASEVVRTFYLELNQDPAHAMRHVAPNVLGADRDAIVRSWRDTEVHAERIQPAQADPELGNSVIVTVLVRHPTGNAVRLRQQITVENTASSQIRAVRLISAVQAAKGGE